MISIAITNFNREQMLYESIAQVIDDERVSEVIISDDCSDYEMYKRIVEYYKPWDKVKVSRTDTNIGCYRNKRRAVSLASKKWVVLFDSDNIMGVDYLESIFCFRWGDPKQLMQPVFARPHFNFSKYAGLSISRHNVTHFAGDETFCTALNAMNYVVNRDQYLKVWDADIKEPWTADSIYMNMKWLEAGN